MVAFLDDEALKALWTVVYDSFELQYRKIYLSDDAIKKKAHVDNCYELGGSPLIHEPQMKWCAVLFLDALVHNATDTEFTAKTQSCVDRRQFNQHKVMLRCIKVRACHAKVPAPPSAPLTCLTPTHCRGIRSTTVHRT